MKALNKHLARIIAGGGLFIIGVFLSFNIEEQWLIFAVFLAAYIIVGGDVVLRAVKNIVRGEVFDENFLMSVATIGAFIISEYPEAVGVMLFYQIGELFQSYAVNKSRRSISELMDIRPDYANLKRGDEIIKVDPDELRIGDIILIKPGERVPLDARIITGNSTIDVSALTGESMPQEVLEGSELMSGCININGLITAEVTKKFSESMVNKILDLVENAAAKKAKTENFITRFAKYYTPVVVVLAAMISVIPPLLMSGETFTDWVYRGLTFLVISCPCALVISIPLTFFGGIGGASRKGILVKGSNYLEALSDVETVVFDKTGTLTKGVFKVQEIRPIGISTEELLEIAAYAENYSDHPISISLKQAYGKEIDDARIRDAQEIPGYGVSIIIDDKTVYVGNARLMERIKASYYIGEIGGTVVHISVEGQYVGYISIADEIKEDAATAIKLLKNSFIKRTVMLTGDKKGVGERVARQIGIDTVFAELLPGDKVAKLEELLASKSSKGKIAFVGDGINDAPVLARADVGIAMGGLGSDAAIEAADTVIMTDEPTKIWTAIKIAKRTMTIVKQNIYFILVVKFGVLALAAMGIATMWAGVLADVGVTLVAVLNASRALDVRNG
ncbi:MAG: heavy metal translocating P-type ATPase [Eubacteriales bacterium]|nr:heavy metal translocating P-type ATPase [Eubacteriales bacterium]